MAENLKYGIKDQYWKSILAIIRANPKVEQVILFGSRALGNYKPGSDIDLCLKGEQITRADLTQLLVHLDELDLPWVLDLVSYSQISNPDLTDHIERVGIEL
ncbi:MAG: nucleotidyltransferase domain-containing protein [Candidatus Cloacimonetes bacterium]|jgi:predicted nucleotidyltransferase|nr:nucleotidyltransferase domain-containing protein [Candidatus Cloacimonadota bacterium]